MTARRVILALSLALGLALGLGGAAPSAHAQPTLSEPPAGAGEREIDTAPPPSAPPDRRPIYVAAGIILLGAIFWWNRRRRDDLERASDAETRRRRAEARAARHGSGDAADDPDAVDLRAAARGPDADPPTEEKDRS